jgi:hypothetical protein
MNELDIGEKSPAGQILQNFEGVIGGGGAVKFLAKFCPGGVSFEYRVIVRVMMRVMVMLGLGLGIEEVRWEGAQEQ